MNMLNRGSWGQDVVYENIKYLGVQHEDTRRRKIHQGHTVENQHLPGEGYPEERLTQNG